MSSSSGVDSNQNSTLLSAQQFERLLLVLALVGLIVTGIPQKFALASWSAWLIAMLGGIESTRILHRFFAAILTIEIILHLARLAYQWFVVKSSPKIFPSWNEWQTLFATLLANIGLRNDPPDADRQVPLKIEYLFLIISIAILAITGGILLNPILISDILPGTLIPIARRIHSDHALLLAGFLIIWRLGFLLWRPRRNPITEIELSQESRQIANRQRMFFVIAGITVIILGLAIIRYATYETSAINTVARHDVPAFSPGFVPDAGDAAVGEVVWSSQRCAFCHGEDASGGLNGEAPALPTKDLTFEAFVIQVREGAETMHSYRTVELPDSYLVHLWAWLSEKR